MLIDMTRQEELLAFLARRHPGYAENLDHWNFCEATYEGGRAWFKDNIHRYIKEGDREYRDRLERAYRFNHTSEVVNLVAKHIFKGDIIRNEDDASEEVKAFWKRATRDGQPIVSLMEQVDRTTSKLGRAWIVVDSNRRQQALTVADEKATDARVYAYVVRPQNALDMGFEEDGSLGWVLFHELARDDADPVFATGRVTSRYRLWTKQDWHLFEIVEDPHNRDKVIVELRGYGEHNLGVVPAIPVDNVDSDDRYVVKALIGDIAYLDRAVANYCSNLDAIIQDQSFSQLAMPAQSAMPGSTEYEKLVEMGTKRIFLFDGEGGQPPFYLSPDVKQAEIIITTIVRIIGEIYHTVGMAGERTKQDNAVGIDNSSGVAKAYDFERLNAQLASKAAKLDRAENAIQRLVSLWHGKKPDDAKDLVQYPKDYDVRGLYDEFDIAQRLSLISAPDEVRREQMRILIKKIFPRISAKLEALIEAGLKNWPPQPVDLGVGGQPGAAGDRPEPPTPKATKNNRQGQVTAKTNDRNQPAE